MAQNSLGENVKLHSTAAERNQDPIVDVLKKELKAAASVLEISSGTGQHIVHFAQKLPHIYWLPSEIDDEKILSIESYLQDARLPNIAKPQRLDVMDNAWPEFQIQALVNINMIHIAPQQATRSLFEKAHQHLPLEGKLILYGPFFESQIAPAGSNIEFDRFLKEKNPDFGIRHREELEKIAQTFGCQLSSRYEMPANNLVLVFTVDSSS